MYLKYHANFGSMILQVIDGLVNVSFQEFGGMQGIWFQMDRILYVIGGNYEDFSVMGNIVPPLRDCWKFSPGENLWEQRAFLPAFTSHGIAFVYNGKIVNGLGYYAESNYDYITNNQILYEFTAE